MKKTTTWQPIKGQNPYSLALNFNKESENIFISQDIFKVFVPFDWLQKIFNACQTNQKFFFCTKNPEKILLLNNIPENITFIVSVRLNINHFNKTITKLVEKKVNLIVVCKSTDIMTINLCEKLNIKYKIAQ